MGGEMEKTNRDIEKKIAGIDKAMKVFANGVMCSGCEVYGTNEAFNHTKDCKKPELQQIKTNIAQIDALKRTSSILSRGEKKSSGTAFPEVNGARLAQGPSVKKTCESLYIELTKNVKAIAEKYAANIKDKNFVGGEWIESDKEGILYRHKEEVAKFLATPHILEPLPRNVETLPAPKKGDDEKVDEDADSVSVLQYNLLADGLARVNSGLGSYFEGDQQDRLMKAANPEEVTLNEAAQKKLRGPLAQLVFGEEGALDKDARSIKDFLEGKIEGNTNPALLETIPQIAEFRWSQMLREILAQDPDVITVQELDHYWDFMGPHLHSVGYQSHYQIKGSSNGHGYTAGMRDGVAIFWKGDKFEYVKHKSEASSPMVKVTLKIKGKEKVFDVLTAHMKSGDEQCQKDISVNKKTLIEGCQHEVSETGEPQLKNVCDACKKTLVDKYKKVELLASYVTESENPFIIGLDMNSNPRSIANRMLVAILTKSKRSIFDSYADLGLSGCSTYKQRWGGAQPEKIDTKVKAQRIDFIFRSEHWTTTEALPFPTMEQLKNNTMPGHGEYLPNIKYGSDHFYAFSKLVLTKPKKNANLDVYMTKSITYKQIPVLEQDKSHGELENVKIELAKTIQELDESRRQGGQLKTNPTPIKQSLGSEERVRLVNKIKQLEGEVQNANRKKTIALPRNSKNTQLFATCLNSRKSKLIKINKNIKPKTRWLVDADTDTIFYMNNTTTDHTVTSKNNFSVTFNGDNETVWLSRSFQKVEIQNKKNNDDPSQVWVKFSKKHGAGRFSNRYFKNDKNTYNFLKQCKDALDKMDCKGNAKRDTAINQLTAYMSDIEKNHPQIYQAATKQGARPMSNTRLPAVRAPSRMGSITAPLLVNGSRRPGNNWGRRRMAEREFSNRRDSPVMVRLLEEIVAAQDD